MFNICRELQSLFNDEREMSMKTLAFIRSYKVKCLQHINVESSIFMKVTWCVNLITFCVILKCFRIQLSPLSASFPKQ